MPPTVWDIESLLRWAYVDQCADQVDRRLSGGVAPAGYGSTWRQAARLSALGTRVDCSLDATSSDNIHADAEAVHDAVMALPVGVYGHGLIIIHAKAGDRPDWMPGAVPRWVPELRENGRPKFLLDARRRVVGTCIVLDPPPEAIDFARKIYTEWWMALDCLCFILRRRHGITAHMDSIPPDPWDE